MHYSKLSCSVHLYRLDHNPKTCDAITGISLYKNMQGGGQNKAKNMASGNGSE